MRTIRYIEEVKGNLTFFYMKIPTKYNIYGTHSPEGLCYRSYLYIDSSLIYLGLYYEKFNKKNIQALGDSIYNLRYQDRNSQRNLNEFNESYLKNFSKKKPIVADTIELSGVDKKGLYWRDIRIGDLCFGYTKVSKEKKKIFDKSLNSLQTKKMPILKMLINKGIYYPNDLLK